MIKVKLGKDLKAGDIVTVHKRKMVITEIEQSNLESLVKLKCKAVGDGQHLGTVSTTVLAYKQYEVHDG